MKKFVLYLLYGIAGIALIPVIIIGLPALLAGSLYRIVADGEPNLFIYILICLSAEILGLGLVLFLW